MVRDSDIFIYTMCLLVILLLIFLSWYFHFHWTRRRLYWYSWNVPGPRNLPLIGAAYSTLKGGVAKAGWKLLRLLNKYPKLCKLWLGPHLIYVTSKAEHAKIILNATGATEKIIVMKYFADFLGDGLVTLPADRWRRHRKIIAPSLNQNILNTYPETISRHCLVLLEKLEKCVGKGEIDPCRYITNCTFDIIGDTLCGFSVNAQKHDETYDEMIDKCLEVVYSRFSRILRQFDPIFIRSKDYKTLKENSTKLRNVATQLMGSCKDKYDKPFISLMYAKPRTYELTEKEIEDEIFTLLMAGTHTNAISMCWLLTILAKHQDVQQKVYEEVMEVVGTDPLVDLEALHKLDYTQRVIKESLRILPTVSTIGRFLNEDIILDGTTVPKGANILVSISHIHRSEDYWKEPLKFDPDRFLPENSKDRHPYAWIPFSGGSRNCIGYKHALMTMKIMTAMIVRKFKVTTSIQSIGDIKFTITIVTKPAKGLKLELERR